jgi:acetylornithine deacetylase/succinyl-diaminopimelate desuccinylase-like protein
MMLLGLAALSAMAASAIASPAPATLPPAATQQLARDTLEQIIAVRSIHAAGTAAVAEAIAARLRAGGFDGPDLAVVADPKFPNQVNVVARLRGRSAGKPVMWVGHEDVVDARPEDWSLPPFKLTEKDGYLYGRGASDMKDADAAMVASMVRLKAEGFVPDRDIIAAFTADEEVGLEQDGLNYLLLHRRDLVDAGLVINPDDTSGKLEYGRRARFTIETSQKIYATFILETVNRGGHSSEPRPDNAIYSLAQGLVRLSRFQFPYRTNPTTRLELARIAQQEHGRLQADLLAVSRPDMDMRAARRLGSNLEFDPLLHTTCVATMLDAGVQENALPQRARATVQCRLMPDEPVEQVRRALEKAVADPEIKVSLAEPVVAGPESPPSARLLDDVTAVTRSMWPGTPVLPVMDVGASDSLYSRSAGIPSYGIGGEWVDVLDDRAHGRDERVSARGFQESVEFTYRLMKRLSRAD